MQAIHPPTMCCHNISYHFITAFPALRVVGVREPFTAVFGQRQTKIKFKIIHFKSERKNKESTQVRCFYEVI